MNKHMLTKLFHFMSFVIKRCIFFMFDRTTNKHIEIPYNVFLTSVYK